MTGHAEPFEDEDTGIYFYLSIIHLSTYLSLTLMLSIYPSWNIETMTGHAEPFEDKDTGLYKSLSSSLSLSLFLSLSIYISPPPSISIYLS